MSRITKIDIKNCTYYFYDDIINIKNVDPNKKDNRNANKKQKIKEKRQKKHHAKTFFYLLRWVCDTKQCKNLWIYQMDILQKNNGNIF